MEGRKIFFIDSLKNEVSIEEPVLFYFNDKTSIYNNNNLICSKSDHGNQTIDDDNDRCTSINKKGKIYNDFCVLLVLSMT